MFAQIILMAIIIEMVDLLLCGSLAFSGTGVLVWFDILYSVFYQYATTSSLHYASSFLILSQPASGMLAPIT
jgi:hypothetical protein